MRENHQTTAFQKPLFLHDSLVASLPCPRYRSERITGGYQARFVALARPKFTPYGRKLQIPAGRYTVSHRIYDKEKRP